MSAEPFSITTKAFRSFAKCLCIPNIRHCMLGIAIIVSSICFEQGSWNIPQYAICYGIIATLLLAAIDRKIDNAQRNLKILSSLNSVLFASIIVVGDRYYANKDWAICFPNTISIIRGCVLFICIARVLYKIILWLLLFFQSKYNTTNEKPLNIKMWGLTILIVKLLYFAVFFPCAFDFDSATGLRTFLDSNSAICDHHPFFVQLIHAAGFLFGQSIGLSSLGFAILTLIFIFVSTKILVYGLKQEIRSGLPYRWVLFSAILYAFFPLFPYLSVNINKDGFFAYLFLFYLFSLFEIYLSQGKCLRSLKFCTIHSIVILFLCLTRHQGFYIVIVESTLLLFLYKGYRQALTCVIIVPIISLTGWSKILLPAINVEPGGKQEAFGVFFQQTAYYLTENPQDLTVQESDAINAILEKDSITRLYKSHIQDPVKRIYKYNPWYRAYQKGPSMFRHIDKENESQELNAYLSAWLSMGCRHPLSYIKATCANSFGFFYNDDRPLIATEPYWAKNRSASSDKIQFYHVNRVAEYYYKHIDKWQKIPFLSWILAIPYYNWIVIIMLSLLAYNKDRKGLSIFLPVLLSILILFICPVAYGRYTYPIVISIPLLLSYLKIRTTNK